MNLKWSQNGPLKLPKIKQKWIFFLDGVANGGFVPDGGYSVVNEKASPESRVCQREPRDFEKGKSEIFFCFKFRVAHLPRIFSLILAVEKTKGTKRGRLN